MVVVEAAAVMTVMGVAIIMNFAEVSVRRMA